MNTYTTYTLRNHYAASMTASERRLVILPGFAMLNGATLTRSEAAETLLGFRSLLREGNGYTLVKRVAGEAEVTMELWFPSF